MQVLLVLCVQGFVQIPRRKLTFSKPSKLLTEGGVAPTQVTLELNIKCQAKLKMSPPLFGLLSSHTAEFHFHTRTNCVCPELGFLS